MTAAFVPGLDLAEAFYREVLAPLAGEPHAAALLGEGSEVLGFDTERSTDHEWGPRAQVFVPAGRVEAVRARIGAGLPAEFRGHPTAWFSLASGGVDHHVEVTTAAEWLTAALGRPPDGLDTAAWLALPQQRLLHVTAGRVFRDDLGELTAARAALAWYPDDVWRWMIAVQWHQVGTTEPLRARCRELGDARGAALLTARLAGLAMELAFLLERRYRPYDKWFGTAFARLDAAAVVGPLLDAALAAPAAAAAGPDDPLLAALAELGRRHDAAAVSVPVGPAAGDFDVGINDAVRPYRVSNAGAYARATLDAVADPALRALLPVGALDQLTHGDDTLVTFSGWPGRLAEAYRAELATAAASR
ncbi:DUF4037 domain-containing protein [Jiangella alba]|uniref:DUF4037 domain-containing protein n=1 Tax=Jiangella alba TaxID=561176 RepID=A0A1H5MWE1_9ACTN|nr:DUF4037 domain-containing protein [Jiangella alba]SEE93596.1 protein of unknown function [Jiangella alba]